MSTERTERPTAKRIKDARKKGQVVRSPDLVAALSLLAVSVVLSRWGAIALDRLATRLSSALSRLDDAARISVGPNDVVTLAVTDILSLLMVSGPFLLTAAAIVIAGNAAQTGWVVASERLIPDFNRLNPVTGLKRLAPSRSGLDLVKTVVAATAVAVLSYSAIHDALVEGPRFVGMPPEGAAVAGGARLIRLIRQAGVALLAMAIADYALQRWRWTTSLKMTKQEVKDEARMTQGNPEIKSRVRKVQFEAHRRRMLTAVKTATVVVTNPTHVAVALRYDRARMAAPVVVAKGQDLLAQRIREIARVHHVPTVENVPLARALHQHAEVGETIPADLFGAVAEVLAYLVRIRQLML